jgi:zinc protease
VISLHPFTLSNGGTGVYLHDPGARAASVQVWYRVGSAHETERTFGTAHLLEHLAFKGTSRVGAEEHMRIIQRLGGQANAFTTEEVTAMHQTLPAESAERALELEADRMENLVLDPEAFSREKAVVLEEYKERIENQPLVAAVTRARRRLLGSHPFAHDPAGTRESLDALTLDDVRDFYRTHYHPGNAVLLLSGPIEPEEAAAMAQRTLGKVSRTGVPSPPLPSFPVTFPSRIEEPIPLKANAYALLFFLPHDPALYHALLLLQSYFSEGENAIMKKRIQEKRFWVLHTGALFYPALPGFLMAFYSLHLPLVRTYGFMDRVLDLLSEVERGGIPAGRLEELKGRMAIGLLSTLHGTEKKTLRLAECAILRGDVDYFFRDEELLRTLSNEAMRDAARRLLRAPRAEILLKGSLWKRS